MQSHLKKKKISVNFFNLFYLERMSSIHIIFTVLITRTCIHTNTLLVLRERKRAKMLFIKKFSSVMMTAVQMCFRKLIGAVHTLTNFEKFGSVETDPLE